MGYSRVVRASGCQRQSRNRPGFHPSIVRHSGIWAVDEAVLDKVMKNKFRKIRTKSYTASSYSFMNKYSRIHLDILEETFSRVEIGPLFLT